MLKHQAYSSNSILPVQVGELPSMEQTGGTTVSTLLRGASVPISPALVAGRQHLQHPIRSASKPISRRHLVHHHHNQSHPQQQQRPKVLRASEYKNLRQVVPSLRRQRDIGKVEVVTEAARYIDHLHKTLIERFVLCGIPDSLKDILGTSDPNELGSQHIMNLVARMAAQQQQQQEQATNQQQRRPQISTTNSSRGTKRASATATMQTSSRPTTSETQSPVRQPVAMAPGQRRQLPLSSCASAGDPADKPAAKRCHQP